MAKSSATKPKDDGGGGDKGGQATTDYSKAKAQGKKVTTGGGPKTLDRKLKGGNRPATPGTERRKKRDLRPAKDETPRQTNIKTILGVKIKKEQIEENRREIAEKTKDNASMGKKKSSEMVVIDLTPEPSKTPKRKKSDMKTDSKDSPTSPVLKRNNTQGRVLEKEFNTHAEYCSNRSDSTRSYRKPESLKQI